MSAAVVRADARALPLPDASVDLIVTSPPYYALRDYRDGDDSVAGQVGNEATPGEYLEALLDCTREWMRVLKPSGSIWVNLADKYSDRADGGPSSARSGRGDHAEILPPGRSTTAAAPRKSRLLLPERYRIGCVDDLRLITRAVVIWSKPNGMPESVTDRVRTSHEDWVHLVKQERYYSAVDEIRQPHQMRPQRRPNGHKERQKLGVLPAQTYSTSQRTEKDVDGHPLGALPGSVWEIPTQPLRVPPGLEVEHFAAFPSALPMRIIAAWSPPGICTACGEGRRPATKVGESSWERRRADGDPIRYGSTGTGSAAHLHRSLSDPADRAAGGFGSPAQRRITGYACDCPTPDAPTRPSLVIDPFGGTGTTALAARALGRRGVSFDLSHDYARLAQWRTTDPGELARVLGKPKPAKPATGQMGLDLEGIA